MALSSFAVLVGALEFVVGLALLASPVRTAEQLKRIVEDEPLFLTVGAATLSICLLVLFPDPLPNFSVEGVVKLLAYVGLAKGILICWSTRWQRDLSLRVLSKRYLYRPVGVVALIVALTMFVAAWTMSA